MSDEQYEVPKNPFESGGNYPMPAQAAGMHLSSLRIPKVRSVVLAQIEELERQLAERKNLLQQLDEQPAVEKILDTLRRLGV